jgi:hypothetical protein
MSIAPDRFAPKREYIESRMRERARAAGIPINHFSWYRLHNEDVSVLTIESARKWEMYEILHRFPLKPSS